MRPTSVAGAYALLMAVTAAILAVGILAGPYRAIERSDYMTYHMAARMVLAGDGECLYDAQCQAEAQRELIGDEPTFENGPLPYNSPPWLAVLVLPLGLVSLQIGFVVFTLLGLAVLAIAAWRVMPDVPGPRILGPALVLTAWPTAMAAIRGQSSLVVVGLLSLSVATARYQSGLALGFSALKPTLAPLWAVWQLVGGHWRAVGTAVVVLIGLVLLSAVVVSPEAVLDYPAHLLRVAGADAPGVHVEEMVNWRGAAARLGVGGWLVIAGTLATLGLVALTWWLSSSRELGAAAAFIASPLVIPHANQHEAVLAMLGVLLAVAAASDLRARLATVAIAMHAVLWVGPALSAEGSAWLLFAAEVLWLAIVVRLAWSSASPSDA